MTVGIINHQHRTKLITKRPPVSQLCNVAFHGEDTICNHPNHTIKISVDRSATDALESTCLNGGNALSQTFVNAGGKPDRIMMHA